MALIRAKGRVAAAITADRRNAGFGRETVESPLPPLGRTGLPCPQRQQFCDRLEDLTTEHVNAAIKTINRVPL